MDSRGDGKTPSVRLPRRCPNSSVCHFPATSESLRSNFPASKCSPVLSTLKRTTKAVSSTRETRLAGKRLSNLSSEWTSNTDSRVTETHREEDQQTLAPELAFVLKLRKERMVRRRRLQHSVQLRRERSQREHEESLQHLRQLRQAKQEAKLAALRKRREELNLRKAQRELMRVVTESDMKRVKKVKLRHVEMAEDFKRQYESPMQERQREILSQKRELRKPIDLQALDRHSKSYDNLLQKRKVAKRAEVDEKLKELKKIQRNLVFYKPKAANIVESENRQRKLAEFERSESTRQKSVRKQRYGFLVRELFPPKVSPEKRAESEMRLRSLSEKKLRPPGKPLDFIWKPTLVKRRRSKSAQCLPSEAPQVVDYLRERRLRHEEEFRKDFRQRSETRWEEIWSDSSLSSPERITEVQKAAQKLDSHAKHQEALLNRMGANWEKSVEATEIVSQLYVESIRAKLTLLSSIE